MASSSGGQEKTEKATPKKLQDARKKGQVPKSADFNAALCLLAGVIYFYISRDTLAQQVQEMLNHYFHNYIVAPPSVNRLMDIFIGTIAGVFGLLAPLFIVLVVIALGANVAQFGFLFAPEAIKPKMSKLNPIEGLKKKFSTRTLFELLKALLKVFVMGVVVFCVAKVKYGQMLKLFYGPPVYLFHKVLEALLAVLLWGGIAYLAIGIIDLIYQRYAFQKEMRMTKQEVKDEYKQTEGDPQVKAWLRRRQREMLMNLVQQEVPNATVVVTNPTHYAVALRYEAEKGDTAPKVVAKGADFMARKIKEIAEENNVPVQENKEVARFLYHNVEIGQEIPPQLYQAVAEILAAVYRLNRS
ncbi:flagellar biosynthetic protein FlhB [Desulfohalotomaculum tongense]|uniref:flagellar biosynthesis protein FlhB n=1 Tax=Desulforadius tongensis TaxID=1216062 RepID=UPI001958F66A|nr:flagellar biosynthesis protein FlhB [Desulforadius tongensis]MBM7854224.1 flagellar biosynthetic protein FlhB [Desulforadius tongensis]